MSQPPIIYGAGPATIGIDKLVDWVRVAVSLSSPADAGIYLATRDSGARAAMLFWQRAIAVGVGITSPQGFPETLPSEPATRLSIALGITGPTHVLCGGAEASRSALEAACWDLEDGTVRQAVVVRYDLANPPECVQVAVLLIDGAPTRCPGADLLPSEDPIHALCRQPASDAGLKEKEDA